MILFRKAKGGRNSVNLSPRREAFKWVSLFHVGQFCESVGKGGNVLGQKCQGVSYPLYSAGCRLLGSFSLFPTEDWRKRRSTSLTLELGGISECYWPLVESLVCFIQWGKAKAYFFPKSVCSLIHIRETALHTSDAFLSQGVMSKSNE